MSVYKIQISGFLYERIQLKNTTYLNEHDAINALTKNLEKNEYKFTVEKRENKTIFLNESGGELAAVMPA